MAFLALLPIATVNKIMLKKSSEKVLLNKGLKLIYSSGKDSFVYTILKPIEVIGNKLDQYDIQNLVEDIDGYRKIIKTDLPLIALLFESGKWRVHCSEFIPSSGPGDFQKEFSNEESAVEFVIKYFFEKNEHIRELNQYLKKNNL